VKSSQVRSGALSSFSGSGSSALISMQSGPSLEGESSRDEFSPVLLIEVTSNHVNSLEIKIIISEGIVGWLEQ
jgi:hypothetical protein